MAETKGAINKISLVCSKGSLDGIYPSLNNGQWGQDGRYRSFHFLHFLWNGCDYKEKNE